MSSTPMIVTVSKDATLLALSCALNEQFNRPAHINLYDIATASFIRSFEADSFVGKLFLIIPVFGGPNEELICAGSETGQLHFWDKETGELVKVLEEHSQHAGCMSFSPVYPGLMASCSDDNHIIIWVTKDLCRNLQDADQKWIEQRKASVKPPINIKNGW
ncbi:hypothetical protein BGZ94_005257 [Podila epigama]|nr:hypothetical protein BGZ94_005257 [Podila epigama]